MYDINNNIAGILNNGNGKIKEYNEYSGELEFEGEYLNGKRNGKGKEYYENGKISFEGEYLNGENWNGKFYDPENINIYEIKNGQGHIKKYYYYGNLVFEGDYLNGKKNGIGKEYFNGELEFEGEY